MFSNARINGKCQIYASNDTFPSHPHNLLLKSRFIVVVCRTANNKGYIQNVYKYRCPSDAYVVLYRKMTMAVPTKANKDIAAALADIFFPRINLARITPQKKDDKPLDVPKSKNKKLI